LIASHRAHLYRNMPHHPDLLDSLQNDPGTPNGLLPSTHPSTTTPVDSQPPQPQAFIMLP
jgi:hypothetical protein